MTLFSPLFNPLFMTLSSDWLPGSHSHFLEADWLAWQASGLAHLCRQPIKQTKICCLIRALHILELMFLFHLPLQLLYNPQSIPITHNLLLNVRMTTLKVPKCLYCLTHMVNLLMSESTNLL